MVRDILPQENDDDDDDDALGVVDEMNSRSTVIVLRNQGLEDTSGIPRQESRTTQESSITAPTFVRQSSSTQSLGEASSVVHAAPLVSNTHDQLRHPRSQRRTRELQQENQQQNFTNFIELMQANMSHQQNVWEREAQER